MRYFKKLSSDGYVSALEKRETTTAGIEITEAEYNALLAEIREKSTLVDKLYSGEITIDDVPAEWREEIQRRVDARIAAEGEAAEQPISGDEFLSMLEGVL